MPENFEDSGLQTGRSRIRVWGLWGFNHLRIKTCTLDLGFRVYRLYLWGETFSGLQDAISNLLSLEDQCLRLGFRWKGLRGSKDRVQAVRVWGVELSVDG